MNEKIRNVISIIIWGGGVCPFAVWFIVKQREYAIYAQINNDLPVIYVNSITLPLYGVFWVGIICSTLSIISLRYGDNVPSSILAKSTKIAVIAIFSSVLLVFPGSLIDKYRMIAIAKQVGYERCSFLELPTNPNSKLLVALAKKRSYCLDPEVQRLSSTGAYSELAAISRYVRSLDE